MSSVNRSIKVIIVINVGNANNYLIKYLIVVFTTTDASMYRCLIESITSDVFIIKFTNSIQRYNPCNDFLNDITNVSKLRIKTFAQQK